MKQTEAARKAGYEFPGVEACRLIRDSRTMPLVMQFRGSRWLELEGGALATLWEIMNDKGQPAGERRGAARELLQAAKEMRADTAAAQEAAPVAIADGSGQGMMGEIQALFAAFRVVPDDGIVTVDAQPLDATR